MLVTALLERDAPLDAKTVHGWTPMDYAVDCFAAAIPLLLHRGVKPTLQALIARGLTDDLRTRLKTDVSDINDRGFDEQTPLTLAARKEQTSIVDLLLEFGADPNRPTTNDAHRAVFIATEKWRNDVMRLLLEAGVDPNADLDANGDSTGSCLSTHLDHKKWGKHPANEAYDLLVEHGAVDPDNAELIREERFALDYAKLPQEVAERIHPIQWMESVEGVEKWAKHYGTERLKDLWWGLGPHSRPRRETMEALVRHGHDVNRPDWWGRTLLQAEAAYGNLDRAKMLIDLGADLHLIDVQSHTNALGYAARQGQVEMVKFFLEQGADKNPDVPDWATPLRYAKDFLKDHRARYSERKKGPLRLNGHNTNEPTSAYEEVIQLLS